MDQFKEVQVLMRSKFAIIIILSLIATGIGVTVALVSSPKEITYGLMAPVIALILSVVLLWQVKLETEVNAIGIYFRFFPFHFKQRLIRWEELENAEVRNFKPISEYGGWGIKHYSYRNRSFTISGKRGLQLDLSNGKKILIGTQRPDELQAIINRISKSSKLTFTPVA